MAADFVVQVDLSAYEQFSRDHSEWNGGYAYPDNVRRGLFKYGY